MAASTKSNACARSYPEWQLLNVHGFAQSPLNPPPLPPPPAGGPRHRASHTVPKQGLSAYSGKREREERQLESPALAPLVRAGCWLQHLPETFDSGQTPTISHATNPEPKINLQRS